jgi:hypothetical protein
MQGLEVSTSEIKTSEEDDARTMLQTTLLLCCFVYVGAKAVMHPFLCAIHMRDRETERSREREIKIIRELRDCPMHN